MGLAAILDVDGTLVDTNYHHALAWYRAFRDQGVTLPVWRIHRHVGMGGDQLVGAVAGDQVEERLGDQVRAAQKDHYMKLIGEVAAFDGARELLEDLKRRGHQLVLASSAKPDEVDYYLDLLEARELADGWTTAADVAATKPAPDLVEVAVRKAGIERAVLIGDSTWDCQAAARAGVQTIAILTGGFSEQELLEAGAVAVLDSLPALGRYLDQTPLGSQGGR
jgi:HAD superfamily hydrolase (TIGR01509 family)